MRTRLRLLLVTLLGLAIIGTVAYWWGIPRLLTISPPDKAAAIRAGSEVWLEFSRPMQPDSVIERLKLDPPTTGKFTWQGNTLVFQPDQPWKAGSTVSVRLEPGARTAGALTFYMRQGATWSFQIRQPALAYLYPANGKADIYSLDPLSGESLPLTDEAGGVVDFSINASGSAIYYSARYVQGDGSAIYRLDLEGSQTSQSTPEPGKTVLPATLVLDCPKALCRLPSASPREDLLAYERTALPSSPDEPNYPQVWLLPLPAEGNSDSGETQAPRLAGEPFHQTLQPLWSNEGMLAYYDTDLSAFVILDPTSGGRVTFPNQTGEPGDWYTDGRYFAAPEINFLDTNIADTVEGLQALANSHLLLFDRLGMGIQDLSLQQEVEDTTPVFSPDGTALAFTRKFLDSKRWTPGRQIWLLRVFAGPGEGGEPRQSRDELRPDSAGARLLTDEPDYNHFDLTWNPAGDQLAYVRFNQTTPTEAPELWLMEVASGQAVRVIAGGYAPVWIP
jgi:hypothetical protein